MKGPAMSIASIPTPQPEDGFECGLDALQEKEYQQAANCFERFLAAAPERSRECAAHTYLVLALLAGDPPCHRSDADTARIVEHLVAAGSGPFTAALAALVVEDRFERDRTAPPEALAGLAAQAHAETMPEADLMLVAEHVGPCQGRTWQRLYRRALRFQLPLPAYRDLEAAPPLDQDRQRLVDRYCAAPPEPPVDAGPARRTTAWAFGGAGATTLAGSLAGDLLLRPWGRGFLVFAALLFLGVALLAVAGLCWRDSERYRREQRRDARQRDAALVPHDSDRVLDGWLRDEARRMIAIGSHRRRLARRETWARHAGLRARAQVLVGLSGLRRTARLYHDGTETDPHSGHEFRTAELFRPLALTACRRGDRDRLLRANRYDVMVFFFEQDTVFVVRADLNLATGQLADISQQTFGYGMVITVQTVELPGPDQADRAVTVRYEDGSGLRRKVLADHCFRIALPGHKIEIATGISRYRAGRRGAAGVAWANDAAQRIIEHTLLQADDTDDGSSGQPVEPVKPVEPRPGEPAAPAALTAG
jgi:hypothetical protein